MPPRICDCAGGLKGWARGSKGDCLGSKGDCFGLATGGEEALPTHAAPPLGLGGEATVGPPPLGGEGPGEATGGPSALGGEATGGRRPWVGSRLAGPWVWSRRLVGPRRSCPGRLQREGTWASTTTPRVRPAPSPSSPQPLPSLAWVVSFKALNSMYEAPLWSHRNSKRK